MSNQIYSVTGNVIDKNTGQGALNVRVEAWDLRHDQQGAFGSSNVDENGHFVLCLDLQKSQQERPPDLYFKVYRGTELLLDTEDTVILKSGEDKEVLIQLNVITVVRPAGKDRVNAKLLFTGVDFFQQSDFKGLYTETKSKAGTQVSFVTDMIMNTFNKSEIKPVRVAGTRQSEVINQPVAGVKQKFEDQKVVVENVLPYDPQLNKATFNSISALPTNLKEGQKVNLYEENGTVRYYSIVKENVSNADLAAIASNHTQQLTKLQDELNVTKDSVAKKDEQLLQVTNDHNEQLVKMQQQLDAANEAAAKKDAELLQVTNSHNDQIIKMQAELQATKDSAAQKETQFNQLTTQLASLRNDQANIMTMLKPENFTKLIKGNVVVKDVQVPKAAKPKTDTGKNPPPK